jgi:hypothetical protein
LGQFVDQDGGKATDEEHRSEDNPTRWERIKESSITKLFSIHD